MEWLLQDLRIAFRRLLRAPGFTAVAVLTLAIGIGANTAIFSVVNAVLLRSLPFGEPERMVLLYTGYPDDETLYPLSAPDFMSLHDEARSLDGVAAVAESRLTMTGDGEPTRVDAGLVSSGFFDVFRVAPVLGRGFRQDENAEGLNRVVLLTDAFWRDRFGADPGVIGRTVTLNGVAREIVGVLPAGFDLPADRQLYFPLAYNATFSSTTAQGRRSEYLTTVARLAPGTTFEQAAAEVGLISRRLQQTFPQTNSENITLTATPLREVMLGDVRTPLLVLLGAVGLVLLIACVNVANLLLARAAARESELAVRTALGAGSGRLVRQLLTESVLLGLVGGAAGLLIAVWGTSALVAARPADIPRLDEIGVDATVVGFALVVAIGTGLLFGLLPALQVARGNLAGSLREGGRSGAGRRGAERARGALVVAEMALAVLLLVGAGLLIRSFLKLTAVDPGFRSERVVTFTVAPPSSAYEDGASVTQFYDRLLERVQSLPGVEAAGAVSDLPLTGTSNLLGFDIENREPPPAGFVQDAAASVATPAYFETLGIPLRRGRPFGPEDRLDAPGVLLVNEAFVRRYFPVEDPIGRRISFFADDSGPIWMEIVGIVGDVPQYALDRDVRPAVIAPHAQFRQRTMSIAVRTSGDPLALIGALRREVAALDADLPIERFTTGEQLVAGSVATPRFYTTLLTIFAAVALVLAAVGIFGVLSFLVSQRTREIGIRMAIGAEPRAVTREVVGRGMVLVGIGAAVGLALALLFGRVLRSQLYGVPATDPLTLIGVIAVLGAVALAATYLPARRAAGVDPVAALRQE